MRRAKSLAESLRELDRFAVYLQHNGYLDSEAPVDVLALASRCGVSIEYDAIRQDGRFYPGPPAKIVVRKGQPKARQRFTVAHELAHWAALAGKGAELRADFISEEVFCNSLAAALLMPAEWLRSQFPDGPRCQNLTTLRSLAAAAEVSMGASVIRMRDLFGWRKTLLHWSRHADGFVFDGEAGVRPSQQGSIIPCDASDFVLRDALNSGFEIRHATLLLHVANHELEVPAELLASRLGISALIDSPELLSSPSADRDW